MPLDGTRPTGYTAIGVFFLVGAFLASLAGVTLLFPGTALDRIWVLNKRAFAEMAPMRGVMGAVFPVVGLALALAGVGWLKRRFWGLVLGVVLIAGNLVGDVIRFASGEWLAGSVGVVIAGLLLFYMSGRRMQVWFKER